MRKPQKKVVAKIPRKVSRSPPSELTIATSVRFHPTVKDALDRAAIEDARSASSLIQKVMTEWLKAKGFLK